jgi:hypothetical protein
MSPARIKAILEDKPFKPFTVYTGDGGTVDVLSPEFAFLHPGGRTLLVSVPLTSRPMAEEDFENHHIGVFLITKVAKPPRRSRGNGRKKSR